MAVNDDMVSAATYVGLVRNSTRGSAKFYVPAFRSRVFPGPFVWHGFRRCPLQNGAAMSSQIQKIVVPTDFSELSERAAVYAGTLASRLNAALYLIHVLPPAGLTPYGFGRAVEAADIHEQSYQAARQRLEGLVRRLASRTLHVTTEVRTGEAAESIAQASVHYGADLVIMGTHGRTGVGHLLAGSIAERVIRTAPCPVLVLRGSGKVHIHSPESSTKVA